MKLKAGNRQGNQIEIQNQKITCFVRKEKELHDAPARVAVQLKGGQKGAKGPLGRNKVPPHTQNEKKWPGKKRTVGSRAKKKGGKMIRLGAANTSRRPAGTKSVLIGFSQEKEKRRPGRRTAFQMQGEGVSKAKIHH